MITDNVGPESSGGMVRKGTIARALAEIGELHVVVTSGKESQDFGELAFVAHSTRTLWIGLLPRWRSLRKSARHPMVPWRVIRHDTEGAGPALGELVEKLDPDLVWSSSVVAWLSLTEAVRQRCVVDLTDQRSVLHREAARTVARRWRRRLALRGRYLGARSTPSHPIPLDRPAKLVKELESMLRWSAFEHVLSRGSRATVTCNAAESRRHCQRHQNHWIIPNGVRLPNRSNWLFGSEGGTRLIG
jgi:hypothetical protein